MYSYAESRMSLVVQPHTLPRLISTLVRDGWLIESDGATFKYNTYRGWALTKDGEYVSEAPIGLTVSMEPTIGVADDSLVGHNDLGFWEFLNDAILGIAVRLNSYTIFPVTEKHSKTGENDYVDYSGHNVEQIEYVGQYGRISRTHEYDSSQGTQRVMYDGSGRRIVQVDLGHDKLVFWRLESLLTLVGHNDPTARVRQKNEELTIETTRLKADIHTAQELNLTNSAKIAYLEAELTRAQGRIDPDMRDLYLSVQRLLTRYFLNGDFSTNNSGDATMFDNVVERYRAARKAIEANRGGKHQ
jgi:YD repeat-containing protein